MAFSLQLHNCSLPSTRNSLLLPPQRARAATVAAVAKTSHHHREDGPKAVAMVLQATVVLTRCKLELAKIKHKFDPKMNNFWKREGSSNGTTSSFASEFGSV